MERRDDLRPGDSDDDDDDDVYTTHLARLGLLSPVGWEMSTGQVAVAVI